MSANNCKGCDKRYPGCHGLCEVYAEYRAEVDRQRRSWKEWEHATWSQRFQPGRRKRGQY